VRIDMLRMRLVDNTVIAATHGRGLFTTTWEKDVYTLESENQSETASLKVYPNPVTDFIGLKTHLEGDFDLQILDMQGKIVLSEKLFLQAENSLQLDLKHLPSGQYVLRLNNGSQQLTQKIIKE